MKKILLKGMAALFALFTLGTMNAAAEDLVGTAPVKMTYIDYDQSDVALGQLDTIRAGYNKVPAVGGTIGFGNTGWGENKIGVLKVDVSSIPGTVQTATLKAKISGSSDSKRTTGWGVALTDNEWAADLTYATAGSWTVSAVLNGGNQQWSSTKSATVFEEKEWDITEALSGGNLTATLLVFETAAAGGYMTEAYVEVTYDPFEATTTKYDFEDGDVSIFTNVNPSRLTIEAVDDEVQGSKVAKFNVTSRNALPMGFFDFSEQVNQASVVAVEFDFNMGSVAGHHKITIGDALVHNADNGGFSVTSKNNYGYGSNGAIFYLGTDRGNLGGGNENYFKINETPAAASTLDIKADSVFGNWLHAKVIVNVDARTVSYTISRDSIVLYEDNGIPFINENAQACTEFDVSFSNTGTSYIDNLTITNYKSNAQFAEYTIRYVNAAGEEIKASRTGNGQVGKLVKLIDSDKESVKLEDNSMKYIYDTDDSDVVTIAEDGSAVITVTFREAGICYAVLNCYKDGTTDILFQFRDINTQWFWEGDSYTLYPYRGAKAEDNNYYFHAATSYNGFSVSFPGSISPRQQGNATYYIATEYYNKVDSVAYYSDIERLALPTTDEGNGTGLGQLNGTVNSWYSFSGGYFDRFSGGRGIRLDYQSYVWTEPIEVAATYKVTLYGRNDKSAAAAEPYRLGLLQEDGSVLLYEAIPADWGSATTGSNVVEDIAIPAGGQLVIMNTSEENLVSLDDISLTITGEYVDPGLVTSIDGVQTMSAQNGVVYNLNGQAVQKAQKGLYIMNGKKYIVK